jgi:hypothetical protein
VKSEAEDPLQFLPFSQKGVRNMLQPIRLRLWSLGFVWKLVLGICDFKSFPFCARFEILGAYRRNIDKMLSI